MQYIQLAKTILQACTCTV